MNFSAQDILKLIARVIVFPANKVCKHWVAMEMLGMLESAGWDCPDELAKAVVDADDETILRLLTNLG